MFCPSVLSNIRSSAIITWWRYLQLQSVTESSHGIGLWKWSSLVKLSVVQPILRSNEWWRYSDISHSMHINSIFNCMPAVLLTRRHYLLTQIPENPQQMWWAANSQRGVSGDVTHQRVMVIHWLQFWSASVQHENVKNGLTTFFLLLKSGTFAKLHIFDSFFPPMLV